RASSSPPWCSRQNASKAAPSTTRTRARSCRRGRRRRWPTSGMALRSWVSSSSSSWTSKPARRNPADSASERARVTTKVQPRARRLTAVLRGPEAAGPQDAIRVLEPREATAAELGRVHPADYLEAIEAFCGRGGGDIDGDTRVSAGSWRAGKLAAGAGLAAVEALRRGEGDAAFLAIRPPGHHALATRPMGFCIINNIAVVAAALAEEGERVLVLDWDAHHG